MSSIRPNLQHELDDLKTAARYRELRDCDSLPNGKIRVDGRELLNFSSNNYLGISDELRIRQSIGGENSFAGSTASRLIVGNHSSFRELEIAIAKLKQTERSLVFSCGYMANLGIITSLVGRSDAVFSDRRVHASIIDAIRLSGAKHFRFNHNDPDHLRDLLAPAEAFGRRLVVTEALFSMDGDFAPLKELVQIKNQFDAALLVDEAHSGGVFGDDGAGRVNQLGLAEEVDLQMGTFGKAYGSYGAYVAGDGCLIDYLINKARSFIFTTGLPPYINKINLEALVRVADEPERRARLIANADYFRAELGKLKIDIGSSAAYIIPLIIGGEEETLEISRRMWDAGIMAVAIRPPTVPAGQSRIRLSLMATHEKKDLDYALGVIRDIC